MDSHQELVDHFMDRIEHFAIFMLDTEGRVLSWNRCAENLKGAPHEVIGQPLSNSFGPDERQKVEELLAVAAEAGFSETEGWKTRKDGTRYWESLAFVATHDVQKQLLGYAAIVRDRSRFRQAEEALRNGEQKFNLLMSGVQEYAIFMMDPAGRVVEWNLAAERLLGYTLEEIKGQHFSIFWTPKEGEPGGEADQELKAAAVSGRASDDRWHIRKDGTHFFANGITSALRDAQGNLRGYAKVLRDNTERKRFEEELRAKTVALEEADKRKNEFLAMLAHELRNPLAPLSTAVMLLQSPRCTTEMRAETVQVMERQVQKLTRLINDLMDVSRITSGKVQLKRERIDLRTVIQNATHTARPLIDEHHHVLNVTLPDEPLWLTADSTRLEQVFENLLNNAAKYTDGGGQIMVTVQRFDGEAVVEVKDSGMGIPPELLPHIFDLFTQADRSLDRAEGGLGIGLTIVRSIVEMHEGSIRVATEGLGKGSTFSVRLPLALSESVSRLAPTVEQLPSAPQMRILVVDDNPDAAKTLGMLLASKGHEVQVTFGGSGALEAAPIYNPHMILLDIGLPGLDGYKIAQRLREQVETKSIVLVALTGYGQPEDRQRAKEAGFDFHLVKPVNIADVEVVIGTISRDIGEASRKSAEQTIPSP